jgi:hypothetical protein
LGIIGFGIFEHVNVRVRLSKVGSVIGMCGIEIGGEICVCGVIIERTRRRADSEGWGSSIKNGVKRGKVGGAESRYVCFLGWRWFREGAFELLFLDIEGKVVNGEWSARKVVEVIYVNGGGSGQDAMCFEVGENATDCGDREDLDGLFFGERSSEGRGGE